MPEHPENTDPRVIAPARKTGLNPRAPGRLPPRGKARFLAEADALAPA
jgi:hypothetical protein